MDLVNTVWGNLRTVFENSTAVIGNNLPNIITGLILIILGWFLAKIISGTISKALDRVGINKLGDKLREIELFKSFNYRLSDIVKKLLYYSIFLVFFLSACETMGLQSVSNGIFNLLGYLPKLLVAGIMFLAGTFIANMVKELVANATSSMNIKGGKFISQAIFYFLVIMVSITSLNQAGIGTDIITNNLTMIIGAILLTFAIGYGLASRDIMASTLASFYSKEKFKVGQTVGVNGIKGQIVDRDSTSVTIASDGKKVMIPLSKLVATDVEIYDN